MSENTNGTVSIYDEKLYFCKKKKCSNNTYMLFSNARLFSSDLWWSRRSEQQFCIIWRVISWKLNKINLCALSRTSGNSLLQLERCFDQLCHKRLKLGILIVAPFQCNSAFRIIFRKLWGFCFVGKLHVFLMFNSSGLETRFVWTRSKLTYWISEHWRHRSSLESHSKLNQAGLSNSKL